VAVDLPLNEDLRGFLVHLIEERRQAADAFLVEYARTNRRPVQFGGRRIAKEEVDRANWDRQACTELLRRLHGEPPMELPMFELMGQASDVLPTLGLLEKL
jgi:hypothetical protein